MHDALIPSARIAGGPPDRAAADAPPGAPDLAFVADRVRPWLDGLLDEEAAHWGTLGVRWQEPTSWVADYLDGGKMLRPRFCFWGLAAVGGEPDGDLVTACGALEMLHTFALIHDDLMDGSARRRGRAALHHAVAREHERQGWAGSAGQYGMATALLAGDMAFALACRVASRLSSAAQPVWFRLITELTAGQYLDLTSAARGERSSALARVIARLKSGRYTVAGPLRLGAAVAGRELPAELTTYGERVGEAFQLRDDLLGLFGDPAATGKPVGEDLQAGKPTLLLAYAHGLVRGRDRALLDRVGGGDLGSGEIAAITELVESTGARARVETLIEDTVATAHAALRACALPPRVGDALGALADAAAHRDF